MGPKAPRAGAAWTILGFFVGCGLRVLGFAPDLARLPGLWTDSRHSVTPGPIPSLLSACTGFLSRSAWRSGPSAEPNPQAELPALYSDAFPESVNPRIRAVRRLPLFWAIRWPIHFVPKFMIHDSCAGIE